jgi:hypothetical protein
MSATQLVESVDFVESERFIETLAGEPQLTLTTVDVAMLSGRAVPTVLIDLKLQPVEERPEDRLMALFEERLVAMDPEKAEAAINVVLSSAPDRESREK